MRWLRMLAAAGLLMAVWWTLSGKADAFHLGAGGAFALAAAAWSRAAPRRRFPAARFAAYVPWLLWQVARSNFRVARLALSPRPDLAPRLVRAAPGVADERALTLLGCSITLTPGTVTIDIAPGHLKVHALDSLSAREIEEGDFERRIARVFRREGDGA